MNQTDKSVEERRKYVTAFNATMVRIELEQIALLGVIDTGALYRENRPKVVITESPGIFNDKFQPPFS